MKKLNEWAEVAVFAALLLMAILLLLKEQFGWCCAMSSLLIIFSQRNRLESITWNLREGAKANFTDQFKKTLEKTDQDLQANEQPFTKENIFRFADLEQRILDELQRKIGGTMKRLVHFALGYPDKIQYVYTPDATIQTDKELIFVEIKHVLKSEFAPAIVKKAVGDLRGVIGDFAHAMGNMKLVGKLILASPVDIDTTSFVVPDNIDLEVYKI